MTNQGKLIVLSAPSGAGKTTLKDLVLPEYPQLKYSISCTTRQPREGEVDGEHYFFKTREEFQEMIINNALVEYMEVHGNYYGTPKFFIEQTLAQGNHVLLDLDVYGKKKFDLVFPEAVGILIQPPSIDVLRERLLHRATDEESAIKLRLKNAEDELLFASKEGKYEHILVNEDLQSCAQEFRNLLDHYLK